MDIEWAKDGADGKLYVLRRGGDGEVAQARRGRALRPEGQLPRSGERPRDRPQDRAGGAVRVVPDPSLMAKVKQGDVLVTDMTDPNWEPVMSWRPPS